VRRDNNDRADHRLVSLKRTLRSRIGQAIADLPGATRRTAGTAVSRLVRSIPEWGAGVDLLVYLAIKDEVDTGPLIEAALADRLNVFAPVVQGQSLVFRAIDRRKGTAYLPGPFGIAEPTAESSEWTGASADRSAPIVICPCRAVDRMGRRLGRGGGYYDRFLSGPAQGCLSVAVAFDLQLVDTVPSDKRDVRVDLVATESQLIRV
jgi:5-formyltetrahydrofolate cyclo-ligase